MRESYNSPEGVYQLARARGMDLVAITDHDVIEGALTMADRPDVIVGCEVTGHFPNDHVRVHLGVLGINEVQHREIQRLRHNVRELLPYLRQESIFTTLNHVASRVNGHITATHIAAVVPWVDALEVRNGSRLASQNRTACSIAEACGKIGVGGSDSHTRRGIGRTWVSVEGARTREEFLSGLRSGNVQVHGRHGNYFGMASDVVRFATGFYRENGVRLLASPFEWRRQAMCLGALVGLPLICLPLVLALAHFMLEERFNRALLFQLVARPAPRVPELA